MGSDGKDFRKPDSRLVLRATNASQAAIRVRIEPWAREYDLSKGGTREFDFTGPDPADIELELKPNEITVHGWSGAVLDGVGLPVPATPARSSNTTDSRGDSHSERRADEIEGLIYEALRPLLRKPLWWDMRVVDLQVFGFGDRVAGQGRNPLVPEFSLHVQCRWRIVQNGAVAVGSADIFWPPQGSAVTYRDFDYDGNRCRRDELLDDFMLHGEEAHVVAHVHGRGTGDAVIGFADGCLLELFPDHRSGTDADGPSEHWRFFAGSEDHFVVTTDGIQR